MANNARLAVGSSDQLPSHPLRVMQTMPEESGARPCKHKLRHRLLDLLDASGACLSGICAVHCVLMPFFVLALPFASDVIGHHIVHQLLFLFVAPVAAVTLGFAAYRSGNWGLLCAGLIGCVLLMTGLELEHEFPPSWLSPATWLNISGGLILAGAHYKNLKARASHSSC